MAYIKLQGVIFLVTQSTKFEFKSNFSFKLKKLQQKVGKQF